MASEKLWAGLTAGRPERAADDFNSSIRFDCRMFRQDIAGSKAHAAMLARQGIISSDEYEKIKSGLEGILADLQTGILEFDPQAEDIHMFVEAELTRRIGEAGKKLHTARSRNDQVALDLRMYLRDEAGEIINLIKKLMGAILSQAEANTEAIMPGYTHLQRAQPIVFAHHILAYASMLRRDIDRICDAAERMNLSPLGSCALAGTTYDIDREMTAELLGFSGITINSIDGVSDRDFCLEILSALSILMMHLSRLAEELILWSSWEFKFIELDDGYTTGSSIMPQKKNPDMAELIRGKTGRVYGNLIALLTTMKGLPLAYNKDMQEDKEAVFDSIDTVKACLGIMAPMVATMKVNRKRMHATAQEGFINATDLADYLTKRGMPFRAAYRMVGEIVAYAMKHKKVLETLTLEEYKSFSDLFEADLYSEIELSNCVVRRISAGGTGSDSVAAQIKWLREYLSE